MWVHNQSALLSFSLSDNDYWKSEDDYWGPEPTPSRSKPEIPITDVYDYWKPEEEVPTASVTNAYDDYWKPEEKEPPAPTPDNYDDYWKPDEKEPYNPVTDKYDSWKEVEPTPPAPEVDGKVGTDDSDYWDATCMSELLLLCALFWLKTFVGWQFIKHEQDQTPPQKEQN